MKKHITTFAGIDLGDRNSVVHILDEQGQMIEETRIPTTREGLERALSGWSRMRIALEVGSHSRWVSRELRALGHEVVVADARKLRLIYQNPRKNDRADAEYLARLLRADEGLLSPVQHRSEESQQHLAVLRARDSLVGARTKLVNHVRGLTKSFGLRLPQCSTESFAGKVRPQLPDELLPALEPVLVSIQGLTDQIRGLDRKIKQLAEETYPETQTMQQIKGVGALTALAFVLTLEDPHRFRTSREVGPYLGLVPRRSQSGEYDPARGITKTGDPYLRRLLVGSAHYMLGPYGQDCHLQRWGRKLAERGGKGSKKRAIIAVARKLAVLLHKLWLTGADFQPFYPHTEAAE
jgi:transposase